MIYLLIVAIIWALSFGLIKSQLTNLDSNFVALVRLGISLIVFLPFLRIKNLNFKVTLQLVFIGMIQYGLMYISYIYSYQFLLAYQVAIFTIFTPLYVTLINDILIKRFHNFYLLCAVLSVIGTAIIIYTDIFQKDFLLGFTLMQISNICFAFGQVFYKKVMNQNLQLSDKSIFALLYLGAVIITIPFAGFSTDWNHLILEWNQVTTLLYLGIVASGICFFLWNIGARKTDTGTLAVFNNVKIPLAVLFSLLFFGESADVLKLVAGGLIILLALYLNHRLQLNNTE